MVIDLQKGIVGYPSAPHDSNDVIANAALLADGFRKNSMPVFLVHVMRSADGKDGLHPVSDIPTRASEYQPDWADIVPQLGPKPGDIVITKRQWGAFYGTDLDLQLRRRGIDTIVLCGISTTMGVESTARFAYEFGYNQIFVEDAMSAMSGEEHDHAVKSVFPRIGQVRSTQDVLSAI